MKKMIQDRNSNLSNMSIGVYFNTSIMGSFVQTKLINLLIKKAFYDLKLYKKLIKQGIRLNYYEDKSVFGIIGTMHEQAKDTFIDIIAEKKYLESISDGLIHETVDEIIEDIENTSFSTFISDHYWDGSSYHLKREYLVSYLEDIETSKVLDFINNYYSAKNSLVVLTGNYTERTVNKISQIDSVDSKPSFSENGVKKQVLPRYFCKRHNIINEYEADEDYYSEIEVRIDINDKVNRHEAELLLDILANGEGSVIYRSIRDTMGVFVDISDEIVELTNIAYGRITYKIKNSMAVSSLLQVLDILNGFSDIISKKDIRRSVNITADMSYIHDSSCNNNMFLGHQNSISKYEKIIRVNDFEKAVRSATLESLKTTCRHLFRDNNLSAYYTK